MRNCRDKKVVLEEFRVFGDDRARDLMSFFDGSFVVNARVLIVDDS